MSRECQQPVVTVTNSQVQNGNLLLSCSFWESHFWQMPEYGHTVSILTLGEFGGSKIKTFSLLEVIEIIKIISSIIEDTRPIFKNSTYKISPLLIFWWSTCAQNKWSWGSYISQEHRLQLFCACLPKWISKMSCSTQFLSHGKWSNLWGVCLRLIFTKYTIHFCASMYKCRTQFF